MKRRACIAWWGSAPLLALVVLAGCGGGGGQALSRRSDGKISIPAQSITLVNDTGKPTSRTLSTPAAVVNPGQEITLPVTVNDASGIAGAAVKLALDKAVFACSEVTAGEWVAPQAQVIKNPAAAAIAVAGVQAGSAGTVLATFRLRVSADATPQNATVKLTAVLCDAQGNTLGRTAGAASVRPQATSNLIGDLMGTGNAEVGSAIKILRVVVGLDTAPAAGELWQWDCNKSGVIEVGDAIMILRCVVGLDKWPIGTVSIAGTLIGTVVNTAGAPLSGVTVDIVDAASAGARATDSTGQFSMSSAPAGDNVVRFAKPGYVTNFRAVSIPSGGSASVKATLNPVGNEVSINPMIAQTVADDRSDGLNARIAFQANSLPAAATTVEITTAVQGDAGYSSLFPGQFTGTPTSGQPGPLQSFAFTTVTVRDADGNKLQLDSTKPATLTIPVSASNDPGTATFPLWRLNETTGIWEQLGVATRVAGTPVVYTAQVNHLSTFNLDLCSGGRELRVIAVDYSTHPEYASIDYPNGSLSVATLDALPRLAGAWVKVAGDRWVGQGNTDANGLLVLSAPAGTRTVTFTAEKAGYKDSRTFYFSGWGTSPYVVYMGLRKDPTWVPPVYGDIGVIIK